MEERIQLNEEQMKPVLDTEGAVLVLAGAGSGKTRVLTARISHIVGDMGVPCENVLAITFTNKAANEMKSRLEGVVDRRMWVCTIHSMCVRILRMYASHCGLNENFSIYSEQERSAVVKQAFKECGLESEEGLLKSIKYHISEAKMLGLTPDEYLRNHARERNIEAAMNVYRKYCAHLQANNALDFDDLLIQARNLLTRDAEAREYLAGKFRYIHVDEFQDTNEVQFDIIKYLASEHGNLFVVGDDDQSIYGWRGAKIENILHFERYYPKAKIYKLQRNYRSTKSILALANASISHNAMRKGKSLWTENEEGDKPEFYEADEETGEALYCARILSSLMSQGYRLSETAVLMRINALTRSFEQEFTKYGIPYKVFGGFKFYERKEIKDMLAYLRIAANPSDDEAILRVMNVPRRGIGEKTVQTLLSYAAEEEMPLYYALLEVDTLPFNSGIKAKLNGFAQYVKELVVKAQDERIGRLTAYVSESSGMYAQYADSSDESVTKRANLDEFQNSVDEFARLNPDATLSDYLQQITLYSDTDEMDDGEYVTLATIHAVKGLEFRAVFLVGLEENVMPTSRAIDNPEALEEERRLMYVAITRAREKLYLTRSKSRYLYGRREATVRSRFVEELKGELCLPDTRAYPRYSGDFVSERSYGRGYGGTFSSRMEYTPPKQEERDIPTSSYSSSGRTVFRPTTPKPATQPQRKDVSGFAVGVKVRHARFGDGVIVSLRGSESNLIISVRFDKAGNKDLAAALAPLEII